MANLKPHDPELNLLAGDPDRLGRLLRDIAKAKQAGQISFTQDGRMVVHGHVGLEVGGIFTSSISRHELVQQAIEENDPEKEAWARQYVRDAGYLASRAGFFETMQSAEHNLLPNDGLDFVLDLLFYSTTKISAWYQGPFISNWTPVATALSNWSGVSSGPLATELADAQFDESGRQSCTFGVAAASQSISTSTATTVTLAAGVSGITLYGSTLNQSSTVAYNATDRILLAATRFSTAKSGLGAADVINLDYTIGAASA